VISLFQEISWRNPSIIHRHSTTVVVIYTRMSPAQFIKVKLSH